MNASPSASKKDYRHPAVTQEQEARVFEFYKTVTGYPVTKGMRGLVCLAVRRHGLNDESGNVLDCIVDEFDSGGVNGLLDRLVNREPITRPHPDYAPKPPNNWTADELDDLAA